MNNLTRLFICSAGIILLFVATALALCNRAMPVDIEPLNDPLFNMSLPHVFWIVCGVGTAAALVCLLTRKTKVQLVLVALCGLMFLGCRTWVAISGISAGFAGYLGGLGRVFGIDGATTEKILCAASVYLLTGCIALFFLERKRTVSSGIARAEQQIQAK